MSLSSFHTEVIEVSGVVSIKRISTADSKTYGVYLNLFSLRETSTGGLTVTSWIRTIRGTFQSALMAFQTALMLRLPYQHQVTVAERKPTFSKVFLQECQMFLVFKSSLYPDFDST